MIFQWKLIIISYLSRQEVKIIYYFMTQFCYSLSVNRIKSIEVKNLIYPVTGQEINIILHLLRYFFKGLNNMFLNFIKALINYSNDNEMHFMHIMSIRSIPNKLFGVNASYWINEWINVAIGCPIEGKGLLIEAKLIKGSRIELVHVSD